MLFLAITGHLITSHAQVRVALKLDSPKGPLPGNALFCDKNYRCGLPAGELTKVSTDETRLLVKVVRARAGFYLLVDTNQNRKLSDEKRVFLRHSGTVQVSIRKQLGPKRFAVRPYEIVHEEADLKAEAIDQFVLYPKYVASGVMRYNECKAPVSLLDMDFDGRFTLKDSDRGSNLRIDKNNDGRFWGKEEHLRAAEIVEYCGQRFLVTSLSGESLTLTPTTLRLAKLNEEPPDFSLVLMNGKVISGVSLKGSAYILDFWASWCAPCVKNLAQIVSIKQEYASMTVYSVNVDKRSRRPLAEKIIKDAGIEEFTSIRGLGNGDPLWKTFGSTNSNRLAIPLYVLVDKDSIIRYAGDGGDSLQELRQEIRKVLSLGD